MRLGTAAVLALALAAAPVLAQDKNRAEVEAKLKNIKVTLDFQNAPLPQVVDYLREISGLNMFIDAKVVEKNVMVSMKVQEISLRSIFSLILSPHGCETMHKDGVVMIMLKEDVLEKTIYMEIHDCRDILYPIQDFPGVDIALTTDSIGTATIDAGGGDAGAQFPIEELVKAHTGGKSWDESQKTTCTMQNGLLIVRHRPEVHQEVRQLLNMLRRNK